MQLFHASNMIIKEPVIINRFATLDFGTGFYTTTNRNQALEFAQKIFMRRGRKGSPTVNSYYFDENAARSSLSFLEFECPNEEWLKFIVHNRQYGRSADITADIIIGPVANDDVFETVALFEAGQLSISEAINRFKVKELYTQILFCNMNALRFLSFEDAVEVDI